MTYGPDPVAVRPAAPGYVSRPDYRPDPFKAMTRYYDSRLVDKGEPSIFDLRCPCAQGW